MNRKEINEIRNHFNPEAKYFTIERVLTAFVDCERAVRAMRVRSYTTLTGPESEIIFETMKKVLSPSLGKASAELAFRNAAYGEDGAQTFLSGVLASELKSEEIAMQFLTKIAETVDADSSYAVFVAFCQYATPRRSVNDEIEEESDHVYRYLLTAICPVAQSESSLVYDTFDDEILRQENKNAIISKAPSDGFLYPAFTDRATDVHHILYYTRTPNDPCTKLVEEFLGCDAESPAESDQVGMKQVLDQLLGDDLTYETVTSVNEKLTEIVAKNKSDDAPTEVTGRVLRRILSESGVPEEKLERTEAVFEACVETSLKPERLIVPKTVMKTPEIVLNIKNEAKNKVHFETINGRHCVVIDLDDAEVEVNGFDLKVPGVLEPDLLPVGDADAPPWQQDSSPKGE